MREDTGELSFLRDQLLIIVDWLKFAETKNGAAFVASVGGMYAVSRIVLGPNKLNLIVELYLGLAAIFLVLSWLTALLSFLPNLYPPFWVKQDPPAELDNPLYFAHAAKYSKLKYLDIVSSRYELDLDGGQREIAVDICDQIVNNSRIALLKFRAFETAAWLLAAAILTPILAVVLWWNRTR